MIGIDRVVTAMDSAGLSASPLLVENLWLRFSQDQYATFIRIEENSVERFIEWLNSGLDSDKAFS